MNKSIGTINLLLFIFFVMLIVGWFSGWMTTSLPVLIDFLKHVFWVGIKIGIIFGIGFAVGRTSLGLDQDDKADQNSTE